MSELEKELKNQFEKSTNEDLIHELENESVEAFHTFYGWGKRKEGGCFNETKPSIEYIAKLTLEILRRIEKNKESG